MTSTPPLPDWIRNADVPGYATAHLLCTAETRLYGTESLYGDWNGGVLLLAKDFGPSAIIHQRLAEGDPRPYRHDEEMRANIVLRRLAEPLREQGLLYGSALANLLRDDGVVSGALPNRADALAYGTRVARFVLDSMPNVRWIVCLGMEAWESASGALGLVGNWRYHRDSGEPLGPLIAAFHPSARVTREQMAKPWNLMLTAS